MEIKQLKCNGVDTTFIKTKKFKTITIQIAFLGEYSKEIATQKSLLTRVLNNSTKKYYTRKLVTEKLFDLYDAAAGVNTYPSYKTSVTVFYIDFINENNLEHESNLTKEAVEFLRELIFNPNGNHNEFSEKGFNEEKRILIDKINNIYNNKNRYAVKQLLHNMSNNEIFSVGSLGNLEDLESITPKSLYQFYQKMLQNENVSIYVIGDFDDEDMIEKLKLLGEFSKNQKQFKSMSTDVVNIKEPKEVIEKQNINQSKLCIGFRTNTDTINEGVYKLFLFNSMFGGIYSSDLFRVIREENSLAYNIASQVLTHVRLLIVSAGIDKENYSKAVELIKEQLDIYKQGNIDEELLTIAKDTLSTELKETEDNPSYFIGHIFRNYLTGVNYTIEEALDIIEKVTIEDIKEVANSVELDTVYFLTSE